MKPEVTDVEVPEGDDLVGEEMNKVDNDSDEESDDEEEASTGVNPEIINLLSSDPDAGETTLEDDLETELDENDYELIDQGMGSVEEDGVVNDYLKKLRHRLRGGNSPSEYKNGTFWVSRRNPAFILHTSDEADPKPLYEPRVFLWFPHHLKNDLKCPQCKKNLKVKGFNGKPIARRIIDESE
jgi:hypothetical protein